MRLIFAIVAVVATGAVPASVFATPNPDADAKAAFQRYDEGWRTYDVETVAAAFAPDFEWTNEVGLRFTDRAALRRFLTRLFQNPEFRAGAPGPLVIRSIRLIGRDVAVISSSEETDGQKDAQTGKVVPVLHTDELTVMRREAGRWLIVDDLTSDESHGI